MCDHQPDDAKRATALRLMEKALEQLEAIDDNLGAMRLQHAIDVVRDRTQSSPSKD